VEEGHGQDLDIDAKGDTRWSRSPTFTSRTASSCGRYRADCRRPERHPACPNLNVPQKGYAGWRAGATRLAFL